MPLALEPPVFRPPSEADSLILQVTVGCSHNRCTFCSMYRSKQFRAKPLEQVRTEILEARTGFGGDVRRVFLAGVERGLEHARRSAEAINAMAPHYTALLTYTPTPHSPLAGRVAAGEVVLPSPRESIVEIREFVNAVTCETYFTCNHASNYVPLTGRVPRAKGALLAALDAALAAQVSLTPEFLRGL